MNDKKVKLNHEEIFELVRHLKKFNDKDDYMFTIQQTHESGIGVSTFLIVNDKDDNEVSKIDITDVSCW